MVQKYDLPPTQIAKTIVTAMVRDKRTPNNNAQTPQWKQQLRWDEGYNK
jgi:hypothetical protein